MQRIRWRNRSCQGDRDGGERNSLSCICITCSQRFWFCLQSLSVGSIRISLALSGPCHPALLFSPVLLRSFSGNSRSEPPIQIWILKWRIFCFNEKSTCTRVFQTRSFIDSASPRAIHQQLHEDYICWPSEQTSCCCPCVVFLYPFSRKWVIMNQWVAATISLQIKSSFIPSQNNCKFQFLKNHYYFKI
jgi:hypothetical protein